MRQEMIVWQWHQLYLMKIICISPTPHHSTFTGQMLFLTPNQQKCFCHKYVSIDDDIYKPCILHAHISVLEIFQVDFTHTGSRAVMHCDVLISAQYKLFVCAFTNKIYCNIK